MKLYKDCVICGNKFKTYPSQNLKCCSHQCSVILRAKTLSERIVKIKRKCAVCKKEYLIFPRQLNTNKYCSAACNAKGRGMAHTLKSIVSRVCPMCGSEYKKKKHRLTEYCSHDCAQKARIATVKNKTPIIKKNCAICGVEMSGKPFRIRNRKYCSKSCQNIGVADIYRGTIQNKEITNKIAESNRKAWAKKSDEERKAHARKTLGRRPMSKLEVKTLDIIKKHSLPYRFTGNGDFTIGRYSPDFISTDGTKIAVEVFSKYHKEKFGTNIAIHLGLEEWKKERSETFAKEGWRIIYLDNDAKEINEYNVVKKLTEHNMNEYDTIFKAA